MPSFFDLQKFAATGIASADMTAFDKARALAAFGGGKTQTMTGVPPLSFRANGTPLISWSMLGNGEQSGTPSPDNIIMPTFCGVRTGNLFDADTSYDTCKQSDGTYQAARSVFYGLKLKPFSAEDIGKTFTFAMSISPVSGNVRVCGNIGGDVINGNSAERSVITFTVASVDDTLYLNYGSGGDVVTTLSNIMLNPGSTPLPYEPYGWAEKITCAGQTTPVYLGQVSTVRKIRKLVLTGEESDWRTSGDGAAQIFNHTIGLYADLQPYALCNMFYQSNNAAGYNNSFDIVRSSSNGVIRFNNSGIASTTAAWKSYLSEQYAAGTPVTIWYILATEQTAIVNEPLCKIGTYADELHSEDAGVTIPTVKGQNTLTVDTELQPSSMTITYKK